MFDTQTTKNYLVKTNCCQVKIQSDEHIVVNLSQCSSSLKQYVDNRKTVTLRNGFPN